MKKLLRVVLAIAALCLTAAAGAAQPKPPQKPAAAAPAALPPAAIAVADLDQILTDYEEFNQLNREFKQFQAQQAVAFDEQYAIRFLEPNEKEEYAGLTNESSLPTSKNRGRVQDLLALAETREKDLERLRGKSEPTEAEKSYLEQLLRLEERGRKETAEFRRKLAEARDAKYKELNRQITEKIDGAIEAVAKEKNLSLVFSKPVVLYGGSDVTQAVLAKLNAKK